MRLSRVLHAAGLSTGVSSWLAGRRPQRRILMLHGIDDVEMPAADFARNAAWLAARSRVVPLGEMVDAIAADRPVDPRGELALTFDDGLRNQFEAAYPILQRLGLPATFFVCPDLIEGRRWIWNQEARARLQALTPAGRATFARECGAPDAGVEALVQHMKEIPIARRIEEEDRLRALTPDFVPSEQARQRFDPLTWDEIARLDSSLVTIGSHTLTHPILPSIDDAALERELAESRRILEQRLDRTVDLFCYPNGSQDDRVHAAVGRVYRAAVTTQYGFVRRRSDAHRLHRIASTPSLALTAWRMHRPDA